MTIISTSMLSARLPGTATSTHLTDAVNRASAFVNTWAINYDPFDDYQESPEAILAPQDIGEICLEVGVAMYYKARGQITHDGLIDETIDGQLLRKRTELKEIQIEPTWSTQTISLNSDNVMVIGSRTTTGGMWPRIIPFTAQVISANGDATTQWVQPDDWEIVRGGDNKFNNSGSSQFPDAWYFVVDSGSSVEGTLRYMRTWRNDTRDYMRYSRAV
jgi:hypothetical protein